MISGFLGVVLRHELAALGLSLNLAAFFVVDLAGSINPDHSLDLRVGNLTIAGRFRSLGSLCA